MIDVRERRVGAAPGPSGGQDTRLYASTVGVWGPNLGGEAKYQGADLSTCGRSSRSLCGLRPMAGDALPVPPEQGVWCDDPAVTSWAGECSCDGTEQGPITVVDFGSFDLST